MYKYCSTYWKGGKKQLYVSGVYSKKQSLPLPLLLIGEMHAGMSNTHMRSIPNECVSFVVLLSVCLLVCSSAFVDREFDVTVDDF